MEEKEGHVGKDTLAFEALFNEWAATYDQTVMDKEGEYNEVFQGYPSILEAVVDHIPSHSERILELGVGTGNLSVKILAQGYALIGIEPSVEMRKIVQRKGIPMDLREGHFLNIPLQAEEQVDAIVSSYAFHHLTLEEKQEALQLMKVFLKPKGKIIFADTSFKNSEEKQSLMEKVHQQNKMALYQDLETEYYEYVADLEALYQKAGFNVQFIRQNQFVWLSIATLIE